MEKERVGFTPRDWAKTPLLGKQILEFEELTKKTGLPAAADEILARRGIFVTTIIEPRETFEILSEKSALIIAHHPQHDLDGLSLLAALPKERNDTFVVASANFLGFPPSLRGHVIPIHGVSRQPTDSIRLKLWRQLNIDPEPPAPLESARLNLQSLTCAAQKLKEGHLVTVFPETNHSGWYNGVGEIIKQAGKIEASVLFASIRGTEAIDKWRIFPPAVTLLAPTRVTVHFSNTHNVSDFVYPSRKEIVHKLQAKYDAFEKGEAITVGSFATPSQTLFQTGQSGKGSSFQA